MPETHGKAVVVSGIRATGQMHLGNYLGVLERFARLSNDPEKQCFFFVADLHTLTTFKDSQLIRAHAPEIVLDMLAAGVNAETSIIYAQSDVPIVGELSWLLACLTSVSDLTGLPTFKDKAKKHAEDVNAGLLFYPVLMAADILGPRANFVPVGEDQMPHLELTIAIARRFNRMYGTYFPTPDKMTNEACSVPGLVALDPEGHFAKMGKSEDPERTIYLVDDALAIERKVRRAPTDPARARRTDPGNPEKCAIFEFHRLLSSGSELAWANEGCRSAGISCLECKDVVIKNTNARLAAFHERRVELTRHPERLREILHEGGARARTVFGETTAYVADKMGVYHEQSRK